MRPPDISIVGWLLMPQANTLRERAFCRLIQALDGGGIRFRHDANTFSLYASGQTLEQLMESCKKLEAVKKIPISNKAVAGANANDELVATLQDLGDVIAYEASQAFTAKTYPGVPGVKMLSDEMVGVIITAMQRELDREGFTRSRPTSLLFTLPMERQRALCERRRYWYSQWGITPESWKTGYWDLWDVSSRLMSSLPNYK